jgi:hypothetical protein
MKTEQKQFDVVVIGGGMAGFCASIAAARAGAKTCLVQDRPVLGGNASSEVRVTVHGAACHHYGMRETGILGEAMNLERRTNHLYPIENGWTNSMHDMALYDIAMKEPMLTLQLNTTFKDVQFEDNSWGLDHLGTWPVATDEKGYWHRPACHNGQRLKAIKTYVANAETELTLLADQFIDCTGDAPVAHLAGCEWRMGSESREETGEIHAAPKASKDTMGNSIHIRCIDTGRPAPFKAPEWAMQYEDAAFFYEQGRKPNEPEGGFWWIEIGVPWDTIYDNEIIRHELTRHALGVWDWMKNKDPKMMDRCKNYALEFIGQVPGKRESRRIMGHHFLNENELQSRTHFEDECAHGGWFIDLHTPGGLLAPTSEPDSALGYDSSLKSVALKLIGPYGIPLKSLISRDVENLSMAGRNLSVTHAALGTVRVMATCGLMGEAIGLTAALSAQSKQPILEVAKSRISEVQQTLLRNGSYLPNTKNEDPDDLARQASVRASSERSFTGLGTWEKPEDINLREKVWTSGKGHQTELSKSPCQWIQLAEGSLESLGLHLKNDSADAQTISVSLRKVSSVWNYQVYPEVPLLRKELEVPARADEFITLPFQTALTESGCYRIELEGPECVAWQCSSNRFHGIAGGHIVGSKRFHWNRLHGEFAFQLSPAQPIFGPRQVLSGVSRPGTDTHLWLSDPAQPMPQWIELSWEKEQKIGTVELTFPSQWVLETHWENPFYLAPHVAVDYRIEGWADGRWTCLEGVQGNEKHQRRHRLKESGNWKKIRVLIEKTHQSPSAGLVEIRCYEN